MTQSLQVRLLIGVGSLAQAQDTSWSHATGSGNARCGGGFAAETGIGYDFGVLRTELTYAYALSNLNQIQVNGRGNFSASGGINTHSRSTSTSVVASVIRPRWA